MPVSIKATQEIEKMRIAGRLASEVLDYITSFIQAGVTTNEIDLNSDNADYAFSVAYD